VAVLPVEEAREKRRKRKRKDGGRQVLSRESIKGNQSNSFGLN
jgi:hypothetical protein